MSGAYRATDWGAFVRDRWQRHDTLDPVARLAAPLVIPWARALYAIRQRAKGRERARRSARRCAKALRRAA
jgi:S-formylglutathione hydrolase FrmB